MKCILSLLCLMAGPMLAAQQTDICVYGGVPCGIAAAIAAKEAKPVQQIDIPALQTKLRAQKQIIDFLPGKPEKFDGKEGLAEF